LKLPPHPTLHSVARLLLKLTVSHCAISRTSPHTRCGGGSSRKSRPHYGGCRTSFSFSPRRTITHIPDLETSPQNQSPAGTLTASCDQRAPPPTVRIEYRIRRSSCWELRSNLLRHHTMRMEVPTTYASVLPSQRSRIERACRLCSVKRSPFPYFPVFKSVGYSVASCSPQRP
jgi:hypothetical protein